jgi:catechol 2,3-dioxygenase-like lactoylglutathione lyase family enzyme
MTQLKLKTILLVLCSLWLFPLAAQSHGSHIQDKNDMKAWTSVTVSVADLDVALDLWVGSFGLEVKSQKSGDDPDLASLWGLEPGEIKRQALVGTPGQNTGLMHFVQFSSPGQTVRNGAEVFDLCPKNLDIYVDDLPARAEELKQEGRKFRNERYSEATAPDGTVFRELHMLGHDDINIVLLQVIGKEMSYTKQGFAGIGPLITIVADATAERRFYQDVIDLDVLADNILDGPEIERMVGLPPGAALDVSIWGAEEQSYGQMEVIDYRGVEGNDLYPRANPPSRGILNIRYLTNAMQELKQRLDQAGISWSDQGQRSILTGQGNFIRFQSPAGLWIEVFEPDS